MVILNVEAFPITSDVDKAFSASEAARHLKPFGTGDLCARKEKKQLHCEAS